MNKKTIAWTALLLLVLLTACGQTTGLHPKRPVTLTLWHNFGGQMQAMMDEHIEEFNTTIGKEKGIVVSVTSISSSAAIQEKLTMIAAGDPGAPEMPDITTCYPATVALLADKGLLAPMDRYFTDEELADYLPRFVEEGRLPDGKLYVFPFAKSTEVLFLNQTLFDRFSTATGVTVSSLATFEGIADAAAQYHRWTDEQTPDIPNDGKAFFTADSFFNLAQVGMEQMGVSLFDGEKLRLDTPEFERIWNTVFEAAVKGGYAIYDGYSSDLSKTGDILCSMGSTAGILFYGEEITYPNNVKEAVKYTVLPYPTFEGGKKIAIQRGGGLAVAKSSPEKEEAAALFLKWFTSPAQNMRFVASTGYLPVTGRAFANHMEREITQNNNPNIQKLLRTATTVHGEYDFYIPPVFDAFNSVSGSIEANFFTIAAQRHEQYMAHITAIEPGAAYEEAARGALKEFIARQP
ncbi:extracellular solute-binding protein [Desulfotomaculum sp. 1211_IL3151]|uniref:extracellular solute-binding protein n=1 Tax=Desulfotomaculum sp. 1211_IL3151 TaxID=3084055 RepID=UPI002FD91037